MSELIVRTGPNRTPSVYHTDEECPRLKKSHRVVTREYIDTTGLGQCSYCADSVDSNKPEDTTCPFCDETVHKLPDHLPCSESP